MRHLLNLIFGPCTASIEGQSAPVLGTQFHCVRHHGHRGDHDGIGIFGLHYRWPR